MSRRSSASMSFKRHHVGAVGRRAVGVLVGLDEDAGDADGDRGARQHRHEFALAARGAAAAAGLLHRMGGIEDHRRAGPCEDRQRAHVGDERVVAERGAALGDQHIRIAGAGDLGDDVRHVPGGEELALLDVDDLAGVGGGHEEIGLPAQEGRDLQHVDRLGAARAHCSFSCTSVSTGRPSVARISAKIGSASSRPMPRGAAGAGAVRLVERGLVDEPDADPAGDLLERRRHLERVAAALERARPGDQRERQRIAEAHGADSDDRIGRRCLHHRHADGS